ncbi:MAG: 3-deoxy-7-phosphoheptulonate synthase [Gammaproteobacteria bacterium]|nr:3-deoxy-7-phosphoheptulonate synthase [Gammaproteobacteria bacterium]
MIVILHPDTDKSDPAYGKLMEYLSSLPGIAVRTHDVVGAQQTLTEVYLVGNTATLDAAEIQGFEVVERVVRVSREYRILGRHKDDHRPCQFTFNGVTFGQHNLHVFAGLCAVDDRRHVEMMMKALQEHGQSCTRMGAYKPRTSPYSFQGHGRDCLPYVFELAGKYGIRVISMEVTHETHIDEIHGALERTGNPTGVMLQIGTRNTQNFELLKSVGRQSDFPVLLKRGFGITLEESLNAAEYLASEGNRNVVFCLRGVKTHFGDPHRNLVDFAHVPTVKSLTRMPVCIDPSHSVGSRNACPRHILDLFHATAQGVIAGANMVLVDFHPDPSKALVDGPQALRLEELPWFLEDVRIAREAYEQRVKLRERFAGETG